MPNTPQPPDDLHGPNAQNAPTPQNGPNAQNAPHDGENQPGVSVDIHGNVPGMVPISGEHTGDNVFNLDNNVNASTIGKLVASETRMPGAGGDIHGQNVFVLNGIAIDDNGFAQFYARYHQEQRQSESSPGSTGSSQPLAPFEMPQTMEEIDIWFCEKLTPRERCYVRAAAILSGAHASLINEAANHLYDTFHPQASQPTSAQGATATDIPPPVQNRTLAARTFTEIREEEDGGRLYWQRSKSNDHSTFGMMALRLIADEIEGSGGIQGQSSEQIIVQWASDENVELSWRAAHALGVIWWRKTEQVRRFANQWVSAKRISLLYSTASLIFGAFETESNQGANITKEMKTLALLATLSDNAREPRQPGKSEYDSPGLSHVVTTSYEMIALVSIDTALDGLDRLLGLSYRGEKAAVFPMTVAVFLYGALSYCTLACQGGIRHILERLAQHAERLTRLRYAADRPSTDVRDRCEQELEIIFFIFFFLVSSSFPTDDETRYTQYGEQATLEAEPAIPDVSGRDVVLASVFADGEQAMRDALVTLLCAALLNGKAKLVVDTLKQWADHLFPTEPTTAQERSRWLKYIRFVVAAGLQSRDWDRALSKEKPQIGFTLLKARLGRWPANKPSGQLALEILGVWGPDD